MIRRQFVSSVLLGTATFAFSSSTCGQSNLTPQFPSKALRLIVPFASGGIADLSCRAVAQGMSEILGQPILVDNKPGAGGINATQTLLQSGSDPHTLLLMSNATAISASLFKTLPYDTLKDLSAIGLIGQFDIALVSGVGKPWKTLQELHRYMQANPGKLNVGTVSVGSTQHLTAQLYQAVGKFDFQIVPFTATPALITSLRAGDIDLAIEILGPVAPQIKAQQLALLATFGTQRTTLFDAVPTVAETGLNAAVSSSWNGLAVSSKVDPEAKRILNAALNKALAMPAVAQRLIELNIQATPRTPDQAQQWLTLETKRWSEIIKKAGITL
jgi:tripartite-type tricarboxylate transporter receptor subunit TctC